MTQQQRQWKYPGGPQDTATSTFDIPAGITNIDIPPSLLQKYRNLNIEFLFSGVTSSDEGLEIIFYGANNVSSFDAVNILPIGDGISITPSLSSSSDIVFSRRFTGVDYSFFRAKISAPSGVTASVVINVNMGGLER